MSKTCPMKPDFLFDQEIQTDGPNSFSKHSRAKPQIQAISRGKKLSTNDYWTKSSPEKADRIIFNMAKIKLPPDASPNQRAEAMKKLLDDKQTKLRFIFSIWPRPDKGPYKDICPANSLLAKMTSNGNQFWAATVFDFYLVQRLYAQPNLRSISTASKLAKWAKANGETDGQAKVSLEWAEDEKDPEMIAPYDIQVIIQEWEGLIRQHIVASQMDEEGEGELQPNRWALPEQWPPKSVFEPEAYPRGWSTEAFSDDVLYGATATPVLQHYIPQHRLPEKLVVHDPSEVLWCSLCPEASKSGYPADAGPTVIYKLKPSEKYADRRKADEEKEAAEEVQAKQTLESFLANPHSSLERPNGLELIDLKEPGWVDPAIFVVFPFHPSLRQPKEVHLYLSPNHLMGKGSHSRVYNAEMVVPRSWLIHELLEEEDGPHGERRLKKWDEKTGMVVREEIKKRPVYMMKSWDDIGTVTYVVKDAVDIDVMAYEGPYRVVHTRMAHPHPLVTKVRLAAKLSHPDEVDLRMLQREAGNYQGFPKHFFEHWSGYNICWPIQEPAVVPQFYGYYVPEAASGAYQSPILLVEQCRRQTAAHGLSVDDKNECISLGLRMNAAGWLHGSIWERNILKQAGPLNESPFWRKMNKRRRGGYGVDWSFRLIDFGRSRHVEDLREGESDQSARTLILDETKKLQDWWKTGTGYWG